MRCYLKSERVKIESLDETLTIRELSAAGQAAIMDAMNEKAGAHRIAAIGAAFSVVEWLEDSPETVAENVGFEALAEIGRHTQRISGIDTDPKDLKSARAVG